MWAGALSAAVASGNVVNENDPVFAVHPIKQLSLDVRPIVEVLGEYLVGDDLAHEGFVFPGKGAVVSHFFSTFCNKADRQSTQSLSGSTNVSDGMHIK